jgi:hypothetical protein
VELNSLGSDVRLDPSELTATDLAEGKFTLKDQEADDPKSENTVFLANDDSYEFVDVHGQHSPARRGVGFFTHGSYFTIQAVPAVWATRSTQPSSTWRSSSPG